MKRASATAVFLLGIGLAAMLQGCSMSQLPSEEDVRELFSETQASTDTGLTEETRSAQTMQTLQAESQTSESTPSQAESRVFESAQETEHIASSEESDDSRAPDAAQLEADRESIGLTEQNLGILKQAQSGNYYYGLCDENQKVLYVEIYQILLKQAEAIKISTTDTGSLSYVYQAVLNDHPELFYLSGYTYTKHTVNGAIKYLTFTGKYLYDAQEVSARQSRIESAADSAIAGITATDSYGKAKAVYEYLILNTQYSAASADNQNICSVFLDHTSVCNGYAKAAQYLFQKLGIPCILVNGNAGGGRHAWNIVLLDGDYYQFDATWGDPSYYSTSSAQAPDIDYAYLNVTTQQITRNHMIDTKYQVPECTAQQDNYFVRENRYFTSYEEDKIEAVFDAAKQNGETYVTIQAADAATYQQLYDSLITNQKIFRYFQGNESGGKYSIAYTSNDTLFTLSFWK